MLLVLHIYRLKFLARYGLLERRINHFVYGFANALNKKSARHSTYKWEEIVKTGKTGKFLFLYVNKTQSVVLEKDKMQPGDDAQILKWIAEAKQAQKVAKERLKNSKK